MMSKEWRPVEGFDGKYLVSNMGEVCSVQRTYTTKIKNNPIKTIKQRILKPHIDGGRNGAYQRVALWHNGKCYNKCVHILVLNAFRGTRPPGQYACHYNDDPMDNRACNLYWGTMTENMNDKRRNRNVEALLDEIGW